MQSKCSFRLEPNRWMKATAPIRASAGLLGAMFAQAAFHHGLENAQHRALQGRIALKEVAQPFGHRQHPFPHRQRRENVIDQVRRCFGHAPRVARGAHAATFDPKNLN